MIWAVIILALLGVPMFAIFGALAMLAYRAIDIDIAIMIGELTRLTSMPMLQALPMFALAGYLLAGSRASERLLRLTRAAFGWMPGGLAMVTIVTCTFLTAFTGASGVTIVALGGLLLPALLRDGYREKAALGLVTSGGNMGVLFAPSLPLILYAVIAQPISGEVTVDALFRAGILPGLLALLVLCGYGVWAGLHAKIPRRPLELRELGAALWEAKWEIPIPFVVLGSIYSGWLVASEAAVLTAAYVLIVEVIIHREIPVQQQPRHGGYTQQSRGRHDFAVIRHEQSGHQRGKHDVQPVTQTTPQDHQANHRRADPGKHRYGSSNHRDEQGLPAPAHHVFSNAAHPVLPLPARTAGNHQRCWSV